MEQLIGHSIKSLNNNTYKLTSIIGEGSQGTIFGTDDNKYVIKLYKNNSELSKIKKLNKLKWLLKIDYPDQFIKPLDIFDTPYVGYIMERVNNHCSLNKLLIPNRKINFCEWYNESTGGLNRRFLIGYKIAYQFSLLHKQNLAYCDISGNNILVNNDSKKLSVCMIDIDNIYIAGMGDVNVLGTSRYIAPEVILKQNNPDILTDSYSLAIILFELLRVGHPYVGDLVADGTPEQEYEAYKGLYPYIDDPDTDINKSSQTLDSQYVFTTEITKLFAKTFLDGKKNRIERPRAIDYAFAFHRASNLLVKCKNCKRWHIAKKYNGLYKCPWCDAEHNKPLRLAFYNKLYCNIRNSKVKINDKHVFDIVLRDSGTTSIANYYINDYLEDSITAFEDYFYIKIGKQDGLFYIDNPKNNILFIQKNKTKVFKKVHKGKPITVDIGDILIFKEIEKLKSMQFDAYVNGLSYRYAVIN